MRFTRSVTTLNGSMVSTCWRIVVWIWRWWPTGTTAEGGVELDTTHAYIGADRFASLLEQLPLETTVLGIDEHTAVILDGPSDTARVEGAGVATVISGAGTQTFCGWFDLSTDATCARFGGFDGTHFSDRSE